MNNLLRLTSYIFITLVSYLLTNFFILKEFWIDESIYTTFLMISIISSIFAYFISSQNIINATTQIPQLTFKTIEYLGIYSFFIILYLLTVSPVNTYKKEYILLFIGFILLFIFFYNYIYIRVLRNYRIGIPFVNTIVIGENGFTRQFIQSIRKNVWMGFRFMQQVKPKTIASQNLKDFILEKNVEAVFINLDQFHLNKKNEMEFRSLSEENGIKFYAISEIYGTHLVTNSYNLAGNLPYLQLFTFPLDNHINSSIKRLFDIIFVLGFFFTIGIWLLPIIAFISFVSQGSPILFSQKRHSIDNKEFNCYKFRTMVNNKDSDKKITIKNDPRVTKFGKLLRKTSLDELPQFFNVLMGDMSIVGPRPHMVNQNKYYTEQIEKYNFRHYVKPGITGLAQVSGFRGEIKKDEDMENRVQADIYYIRNWSIGLDISIIYRTITNMIRGDENAI